MKHCHDLDIAHRDLKLNNVMLDSKYVPKIIDWGLANVFNPSAGTPGYQAPETYEKDKRLNIRKYQKIDMW